MTSKHFYNHIYQKSRASSRPERSPRRALSSSASKSDNVVVLSELGTGGCCACCDGVGALGSGKGGCPPIALSSLIRRKSSPVAKSPT